ncbi:helix-turn-helix domain-containing protein [Sphingomonas phyllosphaerae]|uniref:helix-turn-helix domain-containing protein n=1 Tax=Sphingomonas phyllosphaerae TaxID=257003 RepID=UPI0012DE41F2|nr:helix-turn-helix domain-containing protein [Sphingomonas phyllosphaerae]
MTTLLTPQEAAKRLLISERTLRDLKRTGAISYVAVSARRIAYREEDLAEFIESRVRQEAPVQPKPSSGPKFSEILARKAARRAGDKPLGFLEAQAERKASRKK